jgi:hypothetical protein
MNIEDQKQYAWEEVNSPVGVIRLRSESPISNQ